MAEETTSARATALDPAALADTTSVVVSAYLAHNHVTAADLPALIHSVHGALAGLDKPAAPKAPAEPLKPPVPIKKTITDEFIVSLEDGRPYRVLKRHLGKLGLSPEAYREKWGLPKDYPMTAPAYARSRSQLAKEIGLGQLRRKR